MEQKNPKSLQSLQNAQCDTIEFRCKLNVMVQWVSATLPQEYFFPPKGNDNEGWYDYDYFSQLVGYNDHVMEHPNPACVTLIFQF